MNTTAYYRRLATEHETRLEWGHAADAWQMAIDAYPPHDSLGQRDLENMEQRRQDCLRSYFPA